MTSDVTLSNAVRQSQKTQASSTGLAEDFSEFLTLLTVQLQNQDPLSPMETNEFTNQLVAFTGVEQQINTNQKLDDLVALSLGNSFSASLNYVGKDASYVSSEFYYDGTTPAEIKYALDSNAFEATIRVVDETGNVVYEQDAQTGTGSHDFVWNGLDDNGQQLPEGTYSIRIDALSIESQDVSIFAIIGDRAVSVGNILNVKVANNQPANNDSADDASSEDQNNNNTGA